jgi:pyruvate dehydrogenase E2 component (dihydrolipoamide acetyltransferase)
MREAIARYTQATMSEVPHFYLTMQIDMTEAIALRARLNKALSPRTRVSLNALVMKACAVALLKYPVFNATFEGDHLNVHPHVNVGMAVALPEGLVVPAIPECESKSVVEIAAAAKDLAARARAGTLRQDEYTGTFSVSNLGMYDVDAFTAIVVSPQVDVLAVGAARPTPVVRDGDIVVREMMSVTLSTDHRAANGAEAAQFVGEIKRALEDPETMDAQA